MEDMLDQNLDGLTASIRAKKAALDQQRPLAQAAMRQLQKYYDVELTYTSNAIEGNTLTHRETAEVIEHGITVGGKKLKDHLEAVDHYEAVLWVRDLAGRDTPIGENTVCEGSLAVATPCAILAGADVPGPSITLFAGRGCLMRALPYRSNHPKSFPQPAP